MHVLLMALFVLPAVAFGGVVLGLPEPVAPVPMGVFLHRCVTAGRDIYVIGGMNSSGRVWHARVGEDGLLTPWRSVTPLPKNQAGMMYHAVVAGQGCLYVLGGQYINEDGKTITTVNVFYTRVAADGSLGSWTPTSPLPEPRKNGVVTIYDRRVFYIGGQYFNQVFSAAIEEEGGLSRWREEPKLISNRYEGGAVAHGGYLYVIGGLIQHGTTSDSVFRSRIGNDNVLDKWRHTEPLPAKIGGLTTATLGRYVLVAGGFGNAFESRSGEILATMIDAEGQFTAWKNVGRLPIPEATNVQTVVVGNSLYVIGGLVAGTSNKILASVHRIPITIEEEPHHE